MAASESHTVKQYIYGGTGGNGGVGSKQGGSGGPGEGPRMNYDIRAEHVNFGIQIRGSRPEEQQQRDAEERARIIEWLSPINFFLRHADISSARQFWEDPLVPWHSRCREDSTCFNGCRPSCC